MRRPNHLVLEFDNKHIIGTPHYWAFRFLDGSTTTPAFLRNLNIRRKYVREVKHSPAFIISSKFLLDPQKYTLRPESHHSSCFFKKSTNEAILRVFERESGSVRRGVRKYLLKYSKSTGRDSYLYLKMEEFRYSQRNLRRVFLRNWIAGHYVEKSRPNLLITVVNVNFLRKERLYTKLKYSRTPAYDIVSGGAAALLAGFIGFLVSEKFGFELVDSGDFYFFFMYVVFAAFTLRPLLFSTDPARGFWDLFGPGRLINFYKALVFTTYYSIKYRRDKH